MEELCRSTVARTPIIRPATGLARTTLSRNTSPAARPELIPKLIVSHKTQTQTEIMFAVAYRDGATQSFQQEDYQKYCQNHVHRQHTLNIVPIYSKVQLYSQSYYCTSQLCCCNQIIGRSRFQQTDFAFAEHFCYNFNL